MNAPFKVTTMKPNSLLRARFHWLFPLFILVTPCRAQGFELGLSYARTQVNVDGHESKGPGLQAALDFGEIGRARFQVCGGFERLTIESTTTAMSNLGIQCSIWSQEYQGHALLALEARSEHLSTPSETQGYGRAWLRGGIGFRGIIVPLFPFKTAYFAQGTETVVPFTRIEYAVPLWKRDLTGVATPTWELRMQAGVRFNLD
ncbi:MAG: hypothetical protein Q8O00_05680 [Holophaga sp.]|nr:hypothetical protein [Holophaga sp.]